MEAAIALACQREGVMKAELTELYLDDNAGVKKNPQLKARRAPGVGVMKN